MKEKEEKRNEKEKEKKKKKNKKKKKKKEKKENLKELNHWINLVNSLIFLTLRKIDWFFVSLS